MGSTPAIFKSEAGSAGSGSNHLGAAGVCTSGVRGRLPLGNKPGKVTSKGSDRVISPLGEEREAGGRGKGKPYSPIGTKFSEKKSTKLKPPIPRVP